MSQETTRHKIADDDELSENGSRVLTEIEGREIAVFRYDDEYYAVLNYCCHQAGPLCEGQLTGKMSVGEDGWEWQYDNEEKLIVCPWHHWRFDITTGKNIDDERYKVPTYAVEVDGDDIYVVF